MLRSLSVFLAATIVFSSASYAQDTIVTASVDKEKVRTAEVFTYQVEIKGEFTSPKIALPDFKDFRVVAQNQSKSYSFKEGKTHLTLKLTLMLFASNPGTFTISEVIVEDKESRFMSNSITIVVTGKPLEKKRLIPRDIDSGIDI